MSRKALPEQPAWDPLQVPVDHPDREHYLTTYGDAAAAAMLDEPNQQKFLVGRYDVAGRQAVLDAYRDYAPSETPRIEMAQPRGRVASRRLGLGLGGAVLATAVAVGAAHNMLPGMSNSHRTGVATGASHEGRGSRITVEERRQAERILSDATGCYAFGETPLSTRTMKVFGQERQFIAIPIRDSSTHTPAQDHWQSRRGDQSVAFQASSFLASFSTYRGKRVADGQPELHGFVTPAPGVTERSTKYDLLLQVTPGHPGRRVADISYAAAVGVMAGGEPFTMLGAERACGSISFTVKPDGTVTDLQAQPAGPDNNALKPLEDPYQALGGSFPASSSP